MWLYLLIFAIPLFVYLSDSGGTIKKSSRFLTMYILFLALIVGCGDMLGGYDRYIYADVFDSIADDVSNGVSIKHIYAFGLFETGYSYLNWLIAHITINRYIFIFIVTCIIYTNIFVAFKRHIKNYPFAFMLFLGTMFFFTFTYLRQVLGVSFAMLSIKYLIERDAKKFFLVAFIIASLHTSGLVFSLLWFLPLKKWSQKTVISFLSVCFILGISGITSSLYDIYIEASDMDKDFAGTEGARITYLLEVLFFSYIILKNYDKLKETKTNIVFLNIAFAFCATLLLFIRSDNGGRTSWYFLIGIIYVLTEIAGSVKKSRNPLPTTLIAVSFVLFFRILWGWNYFLFPYKTFFTDGIRENDYIEQKYEYDHNYDSDKFYRPAFKFIEK